MALVNPDGMGTARRMLAAALVLILGAILLLDALEADYVVDPVVTGSLLGAILALVSVDVVGRGRR